MPGIVQRALIISPVVTEVTAGPRSRVNHVRSILFIKHNYWIICDEVTTSHDTKVNLRYNFEGGEEPNIEDGTAVSNSLSIGVVGKSGKWEIENSWVSHCYGERLSSKAAVFSVDLKPGTTRLISFLIPRNGRELPRIREVEGCWRFGIRDYST
jgi:hypothetical protein